MKMKLAPTYDEVPCADNLAGDGEQSHEPDIPPPKPDDCRALSRARTASGRQSRGGGPRRAQTDWAPQLRPARMWAPEVPHESERPPGTRRQDRDLPALVQLRPPERGQRGARLRHRLGPSSNRAARRVVCQEGVVRPGYLAGHQVPQTHPSKEVLDEEISKGPGQTCHHGQWVRRREGFAERTHLVPPAPGAPLQVDRRSIAHIHPTLDRPARTTLEPHVGGGDLMGRRSVSY